MTIAKALSLLAAMAVCAPAAIASPSDTAQLPRRYEARGDGWRLRVSSDGVSLVEKLGRMRWDWDGGPPGRVGSQGLLFEGELRYTYVVANEADTQFRSYRLEISREACRDDKGRIHPTTVNLTYDDGSTEDHGCGGAVPVFLERLGAPLSATFSH